MGFTNLISQIINGQKRIDLKKLPSQGLFYEDDFKISIKRAEIEDIQAYETNYKRNLESVIQRVKKIVRKNVILPKGYEYFDIKSIDVIFLFFEIVQYTMKKEIVINYFDDIDGVVDEATINSKYFNYIDIPDDLMKKYDPINKEFIIDGFKYALPSIGTEGSIVTFLIKKSRDPKNIHYQYLNYDFIYFLGNKRTLTMDEIENLIIIFNDEIPEEDQEKIQYIITLFDPFWKYTLKKNSQVINITNKVDLEKIWK